MPKGTGRVTCLPGVTVLDPAEGLGGRVAPQGESRLAVDRIGGIVKLGAAGVDLVVAVKGGVEGLGDVGQQGVRDAEGFEDPLVLPVVAGVGVKAGDEVELAGAAPFHLFPLGEGLEDGEEHGVVAVDVRAVEARGVGVGGREVGRHHPLVFGVLDEGGEVVADDLGHAGGEDRHHLRLVDGVGVLQPLVQVGLAAEDRAVLGHRVGDRRGRLAEVAVEGGTVVGGAALRAVHEGEAPLKAVGGEFGAQGLAGMGRVDHQRLAGEVLFLVLLGVDPVFDPFDFFGRVFADRLHFQSECIGHDLSPCGRELIRSTVRGFC